MTKSSSADNRDLTEIELEGVSGGWFPIFGTSAGGSTIATQKQADHQKQQSERWQINADVQPK